MRTLLALAGAALALAPAAASAAPRPLDPAHVRLPPSGLVLGEPQGLLLVSLDGRTIGLLRGFRLPPGGLAAIDEVVQREIGATYAQPPQPLLVAPGGRAWQLAGGRLRPVAPDTIPLAGGARIAARVLARPRGEQPTLAISVRAASGRLLVAPGDARWFVVAGRLLVDGPTVTDLTTGARWRHPAGVTWGQGVGSDSCTPAGVAGSRLVAVCARIGARAHDGTDAAVRVFAVAPDGARTPRSGTFRYANFGAESAFVSPDGSRVAATLAVGCGLSPSIVASTAGIPRLLGTPASVLGWAAGRFVAEFAHGECTRVSPPEIDLVDPVTLRRTRIVRLGARTTGWALWS